MRVEIKRNTSSGWETWDIPDADELREAAYAAVRETHHFLTDDNHEWGVEEVRLEWGGEQVDAGSAVVVRKNERSPLWHPSAAALAPSHEDGHGAFWFAVPFRPPARENEHAAR